MINLPYHELLKNLLEKKKGNIPDTVASTSKVCDKMFPNTYVLLKLLRVLPVTSRHSL